MKSVLISIQPNWVEKILNYIKQWEIRKTRPKCEEPFKCFIYCTKTIKREDCSDTIDDGLWKTDNNKVGLGDSFYWQYNVGSCSLLNGKVVGEFICDRIERYTEDVVEGGLYYFTDFEINEKLCMDNFEIMQYAHHKPIYLWHISDLKIYDEPKELSEFKKVKHIRGYHKQQESKIERLIHSDRIEVNQLLKPPKSWCYVNE